MSDINSFNDGQEGVVDLPENHEDFKMVEDSNDGQPEAVDQGAEESRQSREDNHIAKAMRIKAEKEAKANTERARKEAYDSVDEQIRNSGAINPYTNEPFKDMKEFLEYGQKVKRASQEERAENEGKSVEDVIQEDNDKEYIKKKRQEESEEADKKKAEEDRQSFIKADLEEFVDRYPDVDVSKLITNQHFIKFAGSRFEKEPLADLYSDFKELVSEAEENGKQKDSRGFRSTGSGNNGGTVLTASQKRELDSWNRANPDMKMSAKEFLSRSR